MSETTLKQRIQDDMKAAMRAKDSQRLGLIRMIMAAVKQREVDERTELGDEQVIAVLEKMIKQRRESVDQYRNAGRDELADKEAAEIDGLQEYMPAPLDDTELEALIDEALTTSGAQSMKDMGKVMGLLKPKLQGRADMGAVSARIKSRLS